MSKINVRKTVADFREASGRVEVPCLPGCSDCCCDSPVMTYLEWQMISAFWKPLVLHAHPCIWLEDGKCLIYDHRPTLCRAYATVNEGGMKCKNGIRPRDAMTPEEFERLRADYSAAMTVELVGILRGDITGDQIRWVEYLKQCKAWDVVRNNASRLMEKMRGENQNKTV